ncbi:TetR/AcrR family transcriptional regulator [Tenuibacillus multivorans]|uniref:DNA-binding transcriptional regulator, AcrR family n=1 Tax=Tenuibacillus multivorans TaxID=237069 RepID=A0A1G9YGH3_9BACI|nr:TetR/AcrR family transcriptional regulator [Tenuibacillus multivorans]GEL78516.1 TetR family transcriptional regulator [Tenuibacillus multivorans]SDN08289.1 DNA-binding transcriptional regulator, AcrR family [Tenuibacillus multivorans]
MNEQDLLQELMKASEEDKDLTPKQAKILQAAIEMFAEKGYAATSTSEIAKKAGVAEGTIFRHYKTKKDLLISIVSPVVTRFAIPFFADRFVKEVFEKETNENYDDLLREIVYNRFEFVQKNTTLVKILFQEISFHPEIQQLFAENFLEKVYPHFIKWVETYQRSGDISKDFPVNTVLRLIMTTVIGFIITRFVFLPHYDWNDEMEIEKTIEYIRKGLS